jgi:hypothetical protein
MQLALASIFQKFDLSLVDPSYDLELKQSLTIKPKDFQVRATLRSSKPRIYSTASSTLTQTRGYSNPPPAMHVNASLAARQSLYVLYGSNTGTSETFAQRIANDAPSYGQFGNGMSISALTSISHQDSAPRWGHWILLAGTCLPMDQSSSLQLPLKVTSNILHHRETPSDGWTSIQGNPPTTLLISFIGWEVAKEMSSPGSVMVFLGVGTTTGFTPTNVFPSFAMTF